MSASSLTELSASDAPAWRTLLRNAFSSGDYLADFPVWDLGISVSQRRVVGRRHSDGSLVGGAAARIVQLQLPDRSQTTGALIGAVATHSAHRKKGVAASCIGELLNWTRAGGAEWCALWGSEHNYYAKFGFSLEGRQSRFSLHGGSLQSSSGWEWRQGFNPRLIPLLERQRVEQGGLLLGPADYASWFARHTHVRWWSAWRNGEPLAYLAENRGMDLAGIVHEWGGHPQAARELLVHVGRQQSGLQLLAHPRHATFLGEAVLTPPVNESLALIRFETASARNQKDLFWFWGLDSA